MADAMLRQPLPARTFLNINVPKGEPKGYRVTVQAKRNHITSVAERHDPKGQPVLLDRRRAERVGAARSVGLPGGARRLRLGDAAASRSDGAPCAGSGRSAIVREGSGQVKPEARDAQPFLRRCISAGDCNVAF